MQEQVFYQDQHGVVVTSSRLVVGSQMYPMRGITAVSTGEKHFPPKRGFAIFIGLVGAVVLLVGLLAIAGSATGNGDQGATGTGLCFGVFGALMLAGGVWEYRRQQWRHEYAVLIQTGGMQQAAVVTADAGRRDQILAALHAATSSH